MCKIIVLMSELVIDLFRKRSRNPIGSGWLSGYRGRLPCGRSWVRTPFPDFYLVQYGLRCRKSTLMDISINFVNQYNYLLTILG